MYVGETTCDGKKKAYEILGEDVPMYIMDVPQMKREKDILKWKDEIAEFAKKVEEFTGNAITAEKLAESIHIINEKRKALARVYECRKSKCLPISGRDALLMTQISRINSPGVFKIAAAVLTVLMGGLVWFGAQTKVRTPLGCYAALIVMALGTINLVVNPFHSDDIVMYVLSFLCLLSVVWVCVDMLILHNRECSNPMPQFETHTGGEDNA